MNSINLSALTLSHSEFDGLRKLVHEYTGITLSEAKMELVKRRFGPRLRALNLPSFSSYIKYVKEDHKDELSRFSDAITTNLTSFFRENHHFNYLNSCLPELIRRNGPSRRLRVWSAGCSTGQEAYSLAITLLEKAPELKSWDVKILATDLDSTCLEKGTKGYYSIKDLEKMPRRLASKWFVTEGLPEGRVQVNLELRNLITFKRLNFIHNWPVKGPFDIIFCRNVFIYFNKEMQKSCVEKFSRVQNPGAVLCIGHSESIVESTNDYKLAGQTIYERL